MFLILSLFPPVFLISFFLATARWVASSKERPFSVPHVPTLVWVNACINLINAFKLSCLAHSGPLPTQQPEELLIAPLLVLGIQNAIPTFTRSCITGLHLASDLIFSPDTLPSYALGKVAFLCVMSMARKPVSPGNPGSRRPRSSCSAGAPSAGAWKPVLLLPPLGQHRVHYRNVLEYPS